MLPHACQEGLARQRLPLARLRLQPELLEQVASILPSNLGLSRERSPAQIHCKSVSKLSPGAALGSSAMSQTAATVVSQSAGAPAEECR